jgi:outer membrane lipoprotein carrier protein
MPLVKLLWIPLLLFPAIAGAAGAREQLQHLVSEVSALTADFSQTVRDGEGGIIDTSSGRLALARPNRFRWDVLEPDAQHIVADGDHIWVHDVELDQVSVRPQAFDEQSSPLAVLLDPAGLEQQYRIEEREAIDGVAWLRLYPRVENADFDHVDLGFRDGVLVRMRWDDALGQHTEIVYRNWRRNPDLPPSTFRFVPPPGADVVGDLIPAARVQPLQD